MFFECSSEMRSVRWNVGFILWKLEEKMKQRKNNWEVSSLLFVFFGHIKESMITQCSDIQHYLNLVKWIKKIKHLVEIVSLKKSMLEFSKRNSWKDFGCWETLYLLKMVCCTVKNKEKLSPGTKLFWPNQTGQV